ncbi:alkaline phosphatase family protein [soil metagenome]
MKAPLCLVLVAACGSSGGSATDANSGGDGTHHADASTVFEDAPAASGRTIFVIPMENEPSSSIYGNMTNAPYINGLLASAARATMFTDELPALLSAPHYIWMEAGTNAFTDRTFSTDAVPSNANSTASPAHLVTQLEAAHVPWMSYQQGITSNTCPVATSGEYAPKHDPFVFFTDVAGSPPSASNPHCSAHHKSYADFAHDLQTGLSGYVFITPDLCHDMHGDPQCPQGTVVAANIKAGDTWLSQELPAIIAYTQTHDALIFLTWDEGDSSNLVPFVAIGKHVTAGGTSSAMYTHSSMLKSTEEYLGVPVLPSVASATDFAGMFEAGTFP